MFQLAPNLAKDMFLTLVIGKKKERVCFHWKIDTKLSIFVKKQVSLTHCEPHSTLIKLRDKQPLLMSLQSTSRILWHHHYLKVSCPPLFPKPNHYVEKLNSYIRILSGN